MSHRPVAIVVLALLSGACGNAAPPARDPDDHRGDEAGAVHGDDHAHGDDPAHTHHGEMPHRFENADQWSKVFDEPKRDAWQKPDEVVKLADVLPGATVADLGAGTGYFLARLSKAVGPTGKVLGLDVEPDMIRFMKERAAKENLANVEARVVAFDDPGLAPGSVDRILVVDTWHHIEARDRYVPKLAAALRPGGSVIIVDFTMEAEHGPPPKHRIRPEQLVVELAGAGLEPAILEETLPDQYVARGTKRGP